MNLKDWLAASKTTPTKLAARLGVHVITIYKWKSGESVPRAAHMAAITAATDGAVTANDFHAATGFAETQSAWAGDPPKSIAICEIDEQLTLEARALGLDPAAIAGRALAAAIGNEKARRWAEENREAIEAHARYIEEHGLPLDKYRMF